MPGDELLDAPAARGARLVALSLLGATSAARDRLAAPDDAEALHDFRVALRRLRSWTRAHRAVLEGSVGKKDLRRLRALARATGASRDLEVHLASLRELRGELPPRQRAGVDFLTERLEERRRDAEAALVTEVERDFERTARALSESLVRYRVTVNLLRPERRDTMAAASAALVREDAARLRARLEAVSVMGDAEAAHRARIAGKRLRYLLEPLRDAVPAAAGLVRRLEELQDALGDLHDAHVFAAEIGQAMEESAAARARQATDAVLAGEPERGARSRKGDPRAGLMAVARWLHERAERAFAAAERDWLGGRAEPFLAEVEALAAELDARGRRDVEIERKFLLRALPPEAAGAPSRRIDQGYIPGERMAERVRRVRDGDGERWYRTIKLGSGVARTELEEETTREIGAALWRLTSGRRLRKTRFDVPDGDLVWEVDRFDDRDLVLAEVELPSEDSPAEPPEWMLPYLEREVTGEAEYANINLAR